MDNLLKNNLPSQGNEHSDEAAEQHAVWSPVHDHAPISFTMNSRRRGRPICLKHCLIYKHVVNPGKWGEKPREGTLCKIDVTEVTANGMAPARAHIPKWISEYLHINFLGYLTIGNADTVIDRGVDLCIQTMFVSEKSNFTMELPLESNVSSVRGEHVYVTSVKFTIYLEKIHKDGIFYEWDDVKRSEQVLLHKMQGVELYKQGRITDAFMRFSKAFKFLCTIDLSVENNRLKMYNLKSVRVSLLNNMASCQLQFGNFTHVRSLCTKALSIEPRNVKSLYRRALASIELHQYDDAEADLSVILRMQPSNAFAKQKFLQVKTITKEIDAKYASAMRKMFA